MEVQGALFTTLTGAEPANAMATAMVKFTVGVGGVVATPGIFSFDSITAMLLRVPADALLPGTFTMNIAAVSTAGVEISEFTVPFTRKSPSTYMADMGGQQIRTMVPSDSVSVSTRLGTMRFLVPDSILADTLANMHGYMYVGVTDSTNHRWVRPIGNNPHIVPAYAAPLRFEQNVGGMVFTRENEAAPVTHFGWSAGRVPQYLKITAHGVTLIEAVREQLEIAAELCGEPNAIYIGNCLRFSRLDGIHVSVTFDGSNISQEYKLITALNSA